MIIVRKAQPTPEGRDPAEHGTNPDYEDEGPFHLNVPGFIDNVWWGNFEAASDHYQNARDQSGLGVSGFPEGELRSRTGLTFRISYNGKVWDGDTMVFNPHGARDTGDGRALVRDLNSMYGNYNGWEIGSGHSAPSAMYYPTFQKFFSGLGSVVVHVPTLDKRDAIYVRPAINDDDDPRLGENLSAGVGSLLSERLYGKPGVDLDIEMGPQTEPEEVWRRVRPVLDEIDAAMRDFSSRVDDARGLSAWNDILSGGGNP